MLYAPTSTARDFLQQMDENQRELDRLDREAKAAGRLVGRVIRHSYADGYATYQVIKETARKVTIRVCTGLGDDWELPAWGRQASIDKTTALGFLRRADAFEAMLAKRGL
jgi:hypothetical protein